MDRRAFIKAAGGVAAGTSLVGFLDAASAASAAPGSPRPTLPGPPFTLGVASGDPTHHSVVLWTRLAPDPLVPGGGMPAGPVEVAWEIAADERFRRVIRRGRDVAVPEDGHSVHIEPQGLQSDATLFYRFKAAGEISPTGRTRTTPHPGQRLRRVRFATASCQSLQDGYYVAHRALADEDLAFVAFLGDYIYEGSPNPASLRPHEGVGEPTTLDHYRARHAQYRSDLDLQAAHAAFPWILTLDDHEIDNNWADEIPQDPTQQPHDQFLLRRAAAFKAYWEMMPLSPKRRPAGIDLPLYRRFAWGDLLQLDVFDTRQYRSDQPPDLAGANRPDARRRPGALVRPRHQTLPDRLERHRPADDGRPERPPRRPQKHRAPSAPAGRDLPGRPEPFDFDNWDGYRVPRQRLLGELAKVANPVVLTGDRHATWVCDLKQDFYDPASATVGAELTGTSISSGSDRDPAVFHASFDPIMAESPHWKYIDNTHGYLLCDLDRDRWLTDLRTVPTVRSQDAPVSTFARFVTEAGQRGVQVA